MNTLVHHLKNFLVKELSKVLDSSTGQSLRVLFSAPNYSQLVHLYTELTSDLKIVSESIDLSIPVYLLSKTSDNSSHDNREITADHLVKLRNSSVTRFLILKEVGAQISQSSTTTSENWGVDKILSDFDEWVSLPIIQYLIEQYAMQPCLPKDKKRNSEIITFALQKCWELDDLKKQVRERDETWALLQHIFNPENYRVSSPILLASHFGYTSCEISFLGTKHHRDLNEKIATYFDNGLSNGFKALRAESSSQIESDALTSFEDHLASQNIYDATEFTANSFKYYTPKLNADGTPNEWWVILNAKVWSRLLESVEPEKLHTGIKVSLKNKITVSPKGMPDIAQSRVELLIEHENNSSEADPCNKTVEIERVVGQKKKYDMLETSQITNIDDYEFADLLIPPHERFLSYRISIEGFEPVIIKIIVLDKYQPGLIALVRNAKKTKLFTKIKNKRKKSTKAQNKNKPINFDFESAIELAGLGQHIIQLFTASHISLPNSLKGYETDAEQTKGIDFLINKVADNNYSALIESDEECHYLIEAFSSHGDQKFNYTINLTADDVAPDGAKSEFDLLVKMNSSSSKSKATSLRVETSPSRLAELEVWILENDNSFKPVILGPDYRLCWKKPNWENDPLFSQMDMPLTSHPSITANGDSENFLVARKKVLAFLRPEPSELIPVLSEVRLHERMRDQLFVEAVSTLLKTYLVWLKSDYQTAAWCDLVCVHAEQGNNGSLQATPHIILMSPYHPLRLAWQCCAQKILKDAIDIELPCPAASVLSPTAFPDCFVLPCTTAASSSRQIPFVSLASSSDYWQVLGATESVLAMESSNYSEIFDAAFGIEIEGLTSGFNSQQVSRALSQVHKLKAGKSVLNISLSSDQGSSSNCNKGVTDWCKSNLGEHSDEWFLKTSGSCYVKLIDHRTPDQHPEQSALSSLTNSTDSTVKWYEKNLHNTKENFDLSIIAQLGTLNKSFDTQNIRSAIDSTGLTRWRVRKQLPNNPNFIAESRIGKIPDIENKIGLENYLLKCIDELENQAQEYFDSYLFSPNMRALQTAINLSHYTAISSSGIDASCFFGATKNAFLWDYELPSYSRRAGENSGYYLLAQESDGIKTAVRSALRSLGDVGNIEDDEIAKLLLEISRRGMPTLKGLTSGGTESLGEIGMLIALRILQSDFEQGKDYPALIPTKDKDCPTINLVISVDPFRRYFDDLKSALDFPHGERPDLLVFSISYANGKPCVIKITPIEVKVRSNNMPPQKRSEHLKQASLFSEFLEKLSSTATENRMWGIAWRNLIATMLDYGFRIYGQFDLFLSPEWSDTHAAILQRLSHENMLIECDRRGRMILIDDGGSNALLDSDGDGFDETLRISHAQALLILSRQDPSISEKIKSLLGNWELMSAANNASGTEKETHVDEVDDYQNAEKQVDEVRGTEAQNDEIPDTETQDGKALEHIDTGIKFEVGVTSREISTENINFYPGNTALTHLNTGIVGDLGTGKTQLIQSLILQLSQSSKRNRGSQPNILIFDYKKDYSKDQFVNAVGATVIKPFEIPLNFFDIRDSQLDEKRAQNERYKFFADILDKIYPGTIKGVQRQRIKEAVKIAYSNSKILGKVAPTLHDVFTAYKSDEQRPADTPYSIMDDLVDNEYFVSDASKAIPFSEFISGVVVLDLASVGQDDKTKNMLVVIFLNMFYEQMLKVEKKPFVGTNPQSRFVHSLLLVDEADNIMKYEFDVLKKILLQGREFGMGVLLASQYLSHYKTKHEDYIEPLLTWFIHKIPNVSAKHLEQIGLVNGTADMANTIKSLNLHECLYKTFDVEGRFIKAHPFYELIRNQTK